MNQNQALVQKSKTIDENLIEFFGKTNGVGAFEKAYTVAETIAQLRLLLTDDYMKPIMALQGSKLGFKTDKDKNRDGTKGNGYPLEIVKDCLIEATLLGVNPVGNQFNIIAGNCYITKEGLGHILNNYKGLRFSIICQMPKIISEKTANIDANIKYSLNDKETIETIVPIGVKIDSYSTIDSILGKAMRKSRAWLLSTISGIEISDGDIEDAIVVSSTKSEQKTLSKDEKVYNTAKKILSDCKTLSDIDMVVAANPDMPKELIDEAKSKFIK